MVLRGDERVPVGDARERLSGFLPSGLPVASTFATIRRRRAAGLTFVLLSAALLPVPVASQVPCDGPEPDPWVVDFRDRVLAYDGLARYAVSRWGEPVSCQGEVTIEFDGVSYGTLSLVFRGDVSLIVETVPIETSIVILDAPLGFDDRASVEAALRAHAEAVGVAIDWTQPTTVGDRNHLMQTFWDPDPGVNASASLDIAEGVLVAVSFSLAL